MHTFIIGYPIVLYSDTMSDTKYKQLHRYNTKEDCVINTRVELNINTGNINIHSHARGRSKGHLP